MNYFLDTNICIYALKGLFPAIAENMRRHKVKEIKIPAMVQAELFFGAEKSQHPKKTLAVIEKFLAPFEMVAFETESARAYAQIRRELEARGHPIGPNDLIVAATVLGNGGTLVTHNVAEFNRVRGLNVEDWTA